MKTENMCDKELGCLECHGKFSEGNKVMSLRKMVDNGQDGGHTFEYEESCDKV